MAFQLAFEHTHRVIRARAAGVIATQHLLDLDMALIAFLGRQKPADAASFRGLYDFSEMTAIAVPQNKAAERGGRPAIIRGRRVWVRSRTLECGLVEAFAHSQRLAGDHSLTIVDSLEEAHFLLGLDSPRFEALTG